MDSITEWARAVNSWKLPQHLLEQRTRADHVADPLIFRVRAESAMRQPLTNLQRRALEALPAGGVVLDVGVASGAASLPMARKTSLIVGIDKSEAMLREFQSCALAHGIRVKAVLGSWPDASSELEQVDVVVCAHVLYQVQDLVPFVVALTRQARNRVLVDITATHPQVWMSDLWSMFHGLERPIRPTADDLESALQQLGLLFAREDEAVVMPATGFACRGDAVAEVCHRLCLSEEAAAEVEAALGDRLQLHDGLWSCFPPVQKVTTFWWDV